MKRRCACCGEEFEADGGLQEALDLFRRVHGREASGAEELECTQSFNEVIVVPDEYKVR